jgi:hypothetical protein
VCRGFGTAQDEFSDPSPLAEFRCATKLADELGVSKTVVQNLRSGTQTDMKLSNFLKLARAYGYHVVLEKDGSRIGI